MNLLKIIETLDLEKIDQEQFLKPAMRRNLFKKASDFSLKAALASAPFAMMALPTIVKAQTSDTPTYALQLALKLEYLEFNFYTMGVAAMGQTPGLPTTNQAVFQQILQHETAHVKLLANALGANAPTEPTFDFTLGGAANPFGDYPTFLLFSQLFEDTGVRAYKGQAPVLIGNANLTTALQIHSVEARHAAEVRRIRAANGVAIKAWITESDSGDIVPTAFQSAQQAVYGAGSPATGTPSASYPAENNTTQDAVPLTTLLNGTSGEPTVSMDNITEAFDEPLDAATVVTIFKTFCTANC